MILTGSLGKTSKMVDINTGKILKNFERSEGVYKMELLSSTHGSQPIIAGCYWANKNIKIWGKSN